MSEQEYIVDIFGRKFDWLLNHKAVLYGLSANTRSILEAFPSYSIVGLLDGFQESGMEYGKPVLSLDQVVEQQVECIVIVARTNSTKIIAKRIGRFCQEHQIALYDVHGRDLLLDRDESLADHPYFAMSAERCRQEILAHEVISFDVFDTLVMRRVLHFEDVFSLVEKRSGVKGFRDCRIQAEREVNRLGKAPRIETIYGRLKELMLLDDVRAAALQSEELAVEQEVLVARNDMVDLLKFAVAAGKRVYLISDMYWSAAAVEKLLTGLGISGYQRLFVSSEYSCFKSQGLYDIFRQQVVGMSYLHIGDNADADVTCARMHGLDALQIYSAVDMLEISSMRGLDELPANLTERTMLGMLLATVLNSPFALQASLGKPSVAGGYAFGYCFAAPLLTAFMFWLIAECSGRYDRILWSARDGYVFDRMYVLLRQRFPQEKLPEAMYFYTSRMAAIPAALQTQEDIRYAAGIGFAGTAEDMLRQRFFLHDEEILPRGESESVTEYVLRHETIILQRGAELRSNYLRYVSSLGIGSQERLAFFDFVSSGTCQMCLQDILGCPLQGFYFIHFVEDYVKKQQLSAAAFIESGFLYALKSYLSTNYLPIESSIVSGQPTLQGFSTEGKPIYIAEKRKESELQYVQQVQQGVLDYFSDFLDLLGAEPEAVSADFVDRLYGLIQDRYCRVEDCVFSQEVSRDEFCNRSYVMQGMFK